MVKQATTGQMNPGMLQRPQMPTQIAQARSEHQQARFKILTDDWDDLAREWFLEHIDRERLAIWGIPDTSANPLADLARQLSTPGLYGKRPLVMHADDRANEMIKNGGILDKAGLWQKMQHIQYLTLGMGDMLVRISVGPDGSLVFRPVEPQNVYAVVDPNEPEKPTEIWELRLRLLTETDQLMYTWDVWSTGQRDELNNETRPPSLHIYEADSGGKLGKDVSNLFLGTGPLVGDAYPYRDKDGQPILPFSWYKSKDTGSLWNFLDKRGTHKGTLNSALYWSYAGHCARDATGSYVIVAGLSPLSVDVTRTDITSGSPVRSVTLTPGAIGYHSADEQGIQPFVKEVGSGANLEQVARFAELYEMKQAVRWGLSPSDVQRAAANPMSGAALYVTKSGKREFSEQCRPIFNRSDLHTLKVCAIVLKAAGVGDFPEDGYTVVYHTIPMSPQEERERREQLAWEVENGYISKVEAYQTLNPGASRDDAIAALGRVRADEMLDSSDEKAREVGRFNQYEANAMEKGDREQIEWLLANGLISRIDAYMMQHPEATREEAARAIKQIESDKSFIAGFAYQPPESEGST